MVEEVEGLPETMVVNNYELCVIGTFNTERVFNMEVIKHRLAEIWRPVKWMSVRDLGDKLFLFRFYHKLDLRWAIGSGPWTHNGIHEMKAGEVKDLKIGQWAEQYLIFH